MALVFDNGKVISTGVAIHKDWAVGLENALLEAKLAESIYKDTKMSPYRLYTMADHNIFYKFTSELKDTKTINFVSDVQEELQISPWIKSIEFAILNTKLYQDYVTIRCFSKDLMNFIPDKNSILQSIDKEIFKRYSINRDNILAIPPSIIY